MKILGKDLVESVYSDTRSNVERLADHHIVPTLVILKSMSTPGIDTYITQKVKKGSELGINVRVFEPTAAVLNDANALGAAVKQLSAERTVHGILLQKPSHPNVNEAIEQLIDPAKDVDGFRSDSLHKAPVYRGVMRVLQQIYAKDFPDILQSKTFVILGKGKAGGGPVIDGLKKDGIHTIHVIDSKTSPIDRLNHMKYASIIISAVGKRNPIDPKLIPEGSIVIDFGDHMEQGKIASDFEEKDIQERAAYYTTSPGGVGVLTVAYLMDNVVNQAIATLTPNA